MEKIKKQKTYEIIKKIIFLILLAGVITGIVFSGLDVFSKEDKFKKQSSLLETYETSLKVENLKGATTIEDVADSITNRMELSSIDETVVKITSKDTIGINFPIDSSDGASIFPE
jgi:uncharacterized membrane protein